MASQRFRYSAGIIRNGIPIFKVEALLIEAPLVQALSLATKGVNFTSSPVERVGPLAGHFNLLQHKGMVIQLALLQCTQGCRGTRL